MHQLIVQNGKVIEAARSRASAVSPAVLYGHGVFTTIAIHYGRPFLWEDHWNRIRAHAEKLRIDTDALVEDEIHGALLRLIKANNVDRGRARITVLARNAGGAWNLKGFAKEGVDILIMTGDARATIEKGITLTVSPYRANTLSPLTGIKSVNYLDHLLAWEEARERDFDEALVLNERGEVVSATRANLFWVVEGQIHTPIVSSGALAGTTRTHVLKLATELSIPHIEGVYDLSNVGDADEIFLTSAGLGVTHVHTFDYRGYRLGAGSIVVRLREALHQSILALESEESGNSPATT
jgi:branched-subunit amino acid aminotransferase/4-amino-4-deoxychorismate lyase